MYAGLGGWTEGFLAAGYNVVGFDVEQHVYGEHRYPAQLVLQDVLTLHGKQFKDAHCIVASPPCQAYSYRAMPWSRAKALPPPDNSLFEACFRIQREACEAAGRYIPMVVENVCGAQKWVGRARWHYGSYYLWGDVPALMPWTNNRAVMKVGVAHRANGETNFHGSAARATDDAVKVGGDWNQFNATGKVSEFNRASERATKNTGGSWFSQGDRIGTVTRADPRDTGIKNGSRLFPNECADRKGTARKAASARIAKIPRALALYIAETWLSPAAGRSAGGPG